MKRLSLHVQIDGLITASVREGPQTIEPLAYLLLTATQEVKHTLARYRRSSPSPRQSLTLFGDSLPHALTQCVLIRSQSTQPVPLRPTMSL